MSPPPARRTSKTLACHVKAGVGESGVGGEIGACTMRKAFARLIHFAPGHDFV